MDAIVLVFIWLSALTVLFVILCCIVYKSYDEIVCRINGVNNEIDMYWERTKSMIDETGKVIHSNTKQLCKDGMNNEKKFGSLERRVNYIINRLTDASQYEIYKKVYEDEHEQKETRL